MTDETSRAIELEIEVAGTPEEVWQAIATGPGITAWFVPTTVEERAAGAVVQDFGPGDDMKIAGHVQAWEPPHRFQYGERPDPREGGMAFEFLVEAKDQGTCVVRLVNSGFGHGDEWDDQLDAMENGWRIFLAVLKLHVERFAAQEAHRVQATTMVDGHEPDAVWATMRQRFDRDVDVVVEAERAIVFTCDEPAPGTGFLAVEGKTGTLSVSAWFSFYGPHAAAVAQREAPRWQQWVESLASSGAAT